jgi:hypothetical protein
VKAVSVRFAVPSQSKFLELGRKNGQQRTEFLSRRGCVSDVRHGWKQLGASAADDLIQESQFF